MPRFLSILDFFSSRRAKKFAADEDEKQRFIACYQAFRELLQNNHRVLSTMADMQEKAVGGYVFDRAFIRESCQRLLSGVEQIIGQLNVLTDNRHVGLMLPYQACMAAIQNKLDPAETDIPETDYTIDLSALGRNRIAVAGGKFAQLGDVAGSLELPVPPGFVITTWAYRTFMKANRLDALVVEKLSALDIRDYDALLELTDEIQRSILNARMPSEVQKAVRQAYENLCDAAGGNAVAVAVRSSAVHEDIRASFAGQYRSVLNVPGTRIEEEYKGIVASQFLPRPLFYFKDRGFRIEHIAMAVGVTAMIEARVSGVLYSRDPAHPENRCTLINAVRGLGPYAVGGEVPADLYRVCADAEEALETVEIGGQTHLLASDPEGGLREIEVPESQRNRPCLDRNQLLSLDAVAEALENHFGNPQDVEWAIDETGTISILQSRPLRVRATILPETAERPHAFAGHALLLDRGNPVSGGVAAGPVCLVGDGGEEAAAPDGAVLVLTHGNPEFAGLLKSAAAVIVEVGSPLSHLATVAREYRIPAIFNAADAVKILGEHQMVTVDADYANVYDGRVEVLLASGSHRREREVAPVVRLLREINQEITPLRLTDPRGPDFRPDACRTLHDITRFCHEKAMEALFGLSQESHFSERNARQLVSDVPLKWWVIDLEDGILSGARKKTVDMEQIVSIPMRALWEGMTALPWKGPPPVNAKGFMSAVLTASRDPGIEPGIRTGFADRNYILVAKNFCNMSTRLGFHFSTVEAYVADETEHNYASFVFTGGGADDGRKHRRVRLIGRLLDRFGFRVEMRLDTLFARIERYEAESLIQRLKVLGHVIVHTRQLDMAMFNDRMVDFYYNEMVRSIQSAFEAEPM